MTRYLKQQTITALAEPCFNNRRTHASVYKLTCNSQSNACRGSLSATMKLNARVIPTAASVLASTPTGTSATKHNPNLQEYKNGRTQNIVISACFTPLSQKFISSLITVTHGVRLSDDCSLISSQSILNLYRGK